MWAWGLGGGIQKAEQNGTRVRVALVALVAELAALSQVGRALCRVKLTPVMQTVGGGGRVYLVPFSALCAPGQYAVLLVLLVSLVPLVPFPILQGLPQPLWMVAARLVIILLLHDIFVPVAVAAADPLPPPGVAFLELSFEEISPFALFALFVSPVVAES